MNILEVNHLNIHDIHTGEPIVKDISFDLQQGQCLAIVGESGSGKSVTCRSIMKLNPSSLQQSGSIVFQGTDLNTLTDQQMRKRRGKQIGMIMQNGMSAFDPSCVIGTHLRETLGEHYGWSRSKIDERMHIAMHSVMLNHPDRLMNRYPHELSGGMLQRIMIALTLVLEPDILIADEPTTALDMLSQQEVMAQFIRLRHTLGCSVIFISHDLGAVRHLADHILIMKDGKVIERGETEQLFTAPRQEYTRDLLSARLALDNHFRQLMERKEG
ncbi:staphylopine uptake ABC transporter ATP-binding protein CntF [Paenibacillus shenyangensis]|uniref:staphylopine uptake ABC transporter ATP-binding protein CntF n=1 Tax=Paenibacillus sp. A9 TaxID=1284352 RepID=UPI000381A8AC|nr:ABC transporter ATP-binding protein [Paenibacillus sp. A9]